MSDITVKRTMRLYDEVILTNSSEIDLNNTYEIYDTLLYKTFSGDFDDIFLSDNLEDLDSEKRKEVFALARKYSSLCFYLGEFDNWIDSIEGVSLSDTNLVVNRILESYDFLLKLAKDGGEETLKFLNKFSGTKFASTGSVLAQLLVKFPDNDTLEYVLIECSKEDGIYKDFSDEQKIFMFENAGGVLFRTKDGESSTVPLMELKDKISGMYMGDSKESFDIKGIDKKTFESIILGIHNEYNEKVCLTHA
jgi:hypothetical protein